MSTDQAIEQQIQKRAAKAPRVTPQEVESAILSAHYFTAADGVVGAATNSFYVDSAEALAAVVSKASDAPQPLGLLTFCVLLLRNGFTVTGDSACASPENFDAEIGRTIARRAAVDKIWPLLGFRLRDQLCAEAHAASPIEGQEPGSIV